MIVARCIALLGAMIVIAGAARQNLSAPPVVERTVRYAMVAEERQRQSIVRADGRVRQTRTLRSDFLLIKTGPQWAQVFRDVIELDGEHAQLRMFVPESARERYWFEHDSSQDRVEVESTYTNFRRFEVTTTEQIK